MRTSSSDPAGNPLSRSPHLRYLDGWRGLAILSVLTGHFVHLPLINLGRFGVELFFVLSGRLMADVLFLRKEPLPHFFRRRIARVWPGLWVFVLIMGVVYAAPGGLQVGGFDQLAALTFISNYVSASGHSCEVLAHIWSLCIEEHSYLFLALTAFCARRKGVNPILICLAGAGLCMVSGAFQSLVLHGDYYAVYWRTDARASSILLACALFLAFSKNKGFPSPFLIHASLVTGAMGFLLSFEAVPDVLKYSLGMACLAVAVCSIDQAPAWMLKILGHPVLVQTGLWSFSLYLWQQPFARDNGTHRHYVMLLGVIPCALASFYLIEQPARRFLNTHWGRNQGTERDQPPTKADRAISL